MYIKHVVDHMISDEHPLVAGTPEITPDNVSRSPNILGPNEATADPQEWVKEALYRDQAGMHQVFLKVVGTWGGGGGKRERGVRVWKSFKMRSL